jgi:hypothetical protein
LCGGGGTIFGRGSRNRRRAEVRPRPWTPKLGGQHAYGGRLGRTRVWAKAGIPVRARNGVHCPKQASTEASTERRDGREAGRSPPAAGVPILGRPSALDAKRKFLVSPRSDRASRLEDFIYAGAARRALRASICTVRVLALRQQRRHCSRNLDRWQNCLANLALAAWAASRDWRWPARHRTSPLRSSIEY